MFGGNDHDRVIAIAKSENLVMSLASFFAACKYEPADHSFGYTQSDTHKGAFNVPFPA